MLERDEIIKIMAAIMSGAEDNPVERAFDLYDKVDEEMKIRIAKTRSIS